MIIDTRSVVRSYGYKKTASRGVGYLDGMKSNQRQHQFLVKLTSVECHGSALGMDGISQFSAQEPPCRKTTTMRTKIIIIMDISMAHDP